MNLKANYEATANELTNRILALIPDHPEILSIDSPWALFKVPGFNCNDLDVTLAQAQCALSVAKKKYRDV
jgi:hypothetical protein